MAYTNRRRARTTCALAALLQHPELRAAVFDVARSRPPPRPQSSLGRRDQVGSHASLRSQPPHERRRLRACWCAASSDSDADRHREHHAVECDAFPRVHSAQRHALCARHRRRRPLCVCTIAGGTRRGRTALPRPYAGHKGRRDVQALAPAGSRVRCVAVRGAS